MAAALNGDVAHAVRANCPYAFVAPIADRPATASASSPCEGTAEDGVVALPPNEQVTLKLLVITVYDEKALPGCCWRPWTRSAAVRCDADRPVRGGLSVTCVLEDVVSASPGSSARTVLSVALTRCRRQEAVPGSRKTFCLSVSKRDMDRVNGRSVDSGTVPSTWQHGSVWRGAIARTPQNRGVLLLDTGPIRT